MKKITAIFLSFILVFLFVTSASAKTDALDTIDASYESLEMVANKIVEKNVDVSRFSELSTDSIDFLKENDIDTDKIGLVYYEENTDGSAIKILSFEDDNTVSSTTLTGFTCDESGEYRRTELPDLTRSVSWVDLNLNKDHYETKMILSVRVYYKCYYVSLAELYMRPYQLMFWYTNRNNYTPNVANLYVEAELYGGLFTYDSNDVYFQDEYTSWIATRYVTNPSAGVHYSKSQSMAANTCLEVINAQYSGNMYIDYIYTTFTEYFAAG